MRSPCSFFLTSQSSSSLLFVVSQPTQLLLLFLLWWECAPPHSSDNLEDRANNKLMFGLKKREQMESLTGTKTQFKPSSVLKFSCEDSDHGGDMRSQDHEDRPVWTEKPETSAGHVIHQPTGHTVLWQTPEFCPVEKKLWRWPITPWCPHLLTAPGPQEPDRGFQSPTLMILVLQLITNGGKNIRNGVTSNATLGWPLTQTSSVQNQTLLDWNPNWSRHQNRAHVSAASISSFRFRSAGEDLRVQPKELSYTSVQNLLQLNTWTSVQQQVHLSTRPAVWSAEHYLIQSRFSKYKWSEFNKRNTRDQ